MPQEPVRVKGVLPRTGSWPHPLNRPPLHIVPPAVQHCALRARTPRFHPVISYGTSR